MDDLAVAFWPNPFYSKNSFSRFWGYENGQGLTDDTMSGFAGQIKVWGNRFRQLYFSLFQPNLWLPINSDVNCQNLNICILKARRF